MLHRVYLNIVTARLFINCSNTLRNIRTNARENITRTRAKRKAGYFFVARSVYTGRATDDNMAPAFFVPDT